MERELTIGLLKKQIEVYTELIEKLNLAIPVIEKFNGKILNVKLDRELKEVDKEISSNMDSLNVANYNNRSVKINDNWYYINYYESSVKIALNEKRIDSQNTIEAIKQEINRLENSIKTKEKAIADYDNMIKDYEEIANKIREFNKSYDYSIREDINFSKIY